MDKIKQEGYVTPEIEVIEIRVENGFAVTGGYGGEGGYPKPF
jgi:hypothetical protein